MPQPLHIAGDRSEATTFCARASLVAREGAVEARHAAPRVHGVALHLDERNGRVGGSPRGERHAVVAVLPALVAQPLLRAPLVFDEAVTVAVAVALDPAQR